MKLIIDIPKDEYNEIIKGDYIPDGNFRKNCIIAIINGTPLEDIKAEFTSLYPKNVYGGLELGGRSCVFSLNKVLEIIDRHIGEGENE